MPTLNSHTHCQAAQTSRTSQSLSISVSEPTHGRKKVRLPNMVYKNWADGGKLEGISPHQTLGFGGQVIAPKSPPFHILNFVCHAEAHICNSHKPTHKLKIAKELFSSSLYLIRASSKAGEKQERVQCVHSPYSSSE